jgi:PAS domain S-box-containing protein
MEMKIRLNDFHNVLGNTLSEDENIIIMEESGEILFSSQENFEIPDIPKDFTDVLWDDQNAKLFTQLNNLPWNLYLTKKVNPLIATNTQLWIYLSFIGAAGLLLSLLFGVIWSKWIDKPILELTETATEIARGDFTISIPLQKNMLINRLIKIFNYMAEEMDRFKQLDVSEIINEKNKNEAILRNIADGVLVTDNQDRILIINTVAEKWFGLDEEKIVKKPIQEYIKNNTLISLLQEVKDGQIQSSTEFDFQIQETREKKVFQAHAARIQNMEDKLIGVVTVIRDVTKEKEADRIKTELVSMVAHELKSPLTSIYGFSELLLDSNPEDIKAREYAQVILTESTRLTDLVNKFLDLARLEAGRTEIKKNPFDLRQVVDKIVETYKGQAEKKNIRVITEIPENMALAMGDQDMIEQVILNLFSNAVKYSPQHSKIGIESKEDGDNLVISVIDNGYGIPKEALSHIFDKFYRVIDSEGSEDVEGSGLGLALAREIIERLGVGSVFTFTLPRANVTDVK